MARSSRRTGPPANQAITTTLTPITNIRFTRLWDSGPYLLLFTGIIQDAATPADDVVIRPTFDDNSIGADIRFPAGKANTFRRASHFAYFDLPEGPHTFDLLINSSTAVNDSVLTTASAVLVVMQFPEWEPTIDLG